MINLTDIYKAINSIIETNFPGIEIQATDIEEGFNRPSFYVDIENSKASSLMSRYKEKMLSVRIYYFPSKREKYQIESLEKQEKLEEIFFQKLQISDDFYIVIDEVESDVVDGVLQFVFDLDFVQELEDTDESELMDTLDVNIKV